MRAYLATAPVWVTALFQGVLYTIFMTGSAVLQYHDFGVRLVLLNLGIGVVFALGMTVVGRRERRRQDRLLGGLSTAQRREVFRGAFSGTAPADPALRAPAAAVVAQWSERVDGSRVFVIVVATVGAVASLGFAATDTVWWLLGAGGCLAMLVWALRYPVILDRRLAALHGASGAPAAAAHR